jgi:hypothetical protein
MRLNKRTLQGCYYFGCFMPVGFAGIFVLLVVRRLRGKR